MTALMEGGQLVGLSRLSLPFLCGTMLSDRRDWATVFGFLIYGAGGLLFAFFYAFAFEAVALATWWLGTALGLAHGVFVVTVVLPLLPHIHPRMATDYDGPTAKRRLEPPGSFGLNYGRRTPLITVLGHTLYGAILGLAYVVG
jgi:hypothetical protein